MSTYPLLAFHTPGSAAALVKALREARWGFHVILSILIEFGYSLDQLVYAIRDAFPGTWLYARDMCELADQFDLEAILAALHEAGFDAAAVGNGLCTMTMGICNRDYTRGEAMEMLQQVGFELSEIEEGSPSDPLLLCL
jgi:hypothetical protein